MNRIYFFKSDITFLNSPHPEAPLVTFRSQDPLVYTHVTQILKKGIGNSLKIGIIDLGLFLATIEDIKKNDLTLTITVTNPDLCFQKSTLYGKHYYVAYARPLTAKQILILSAAFGVTHLHFFPTLLGESSYQDSQVYQNLSQQQRFLKEGLAQTGIFSTVPQIVCHSSFFSCFSFLPPSSLVLDPSGPLLPSTYSFASGTHEAFIFGPERGWATKELEYFRKKTQTQIYSLHPAPLRTPWAYLLTLR